MRTRTLPVRLTEIELTERRDQLAELVRDRNDAKQKAKDQATANKKIVDNLEAEKSRVAREIREKQHYMEVEIFEETYLERGIAELVRADTGEVIETRSITPAERQAKLFKEETEKAVVKADKKVKGKKTKQPVEVPTETKVAAQ